MIPEAEAELGGGKDKLESTSTNGANSNLSEDIVIKCGFV